MRIIFRIVLLLITVSMNSLAADEMSFATWNLRYANSKDSLNGDGWEKRVVEIARLVRYHDYDIVNMQEMNEVDSVLMVQMLMDSLSDYGVVKGICEDCRDYNPIIYKKSRMTLKDVGLFYFADNPDSASKGWDAYLRRYCTWAKFTVKGKPLYVFNVHWDHKGIEARKQSAKLSLEKIPEIAEGSPVIYAGDINCEAKYDCYKMLEANYWRDARTVADYVYLADSSFNQFKVNKIGKKTLDVIFVTPSIKVYRYGIQRELYYDGKQWRTPSDHNPVVIQFEVR